MQKLKYEVDPHNRLIISNIDKESQVPKYRKVLDGTFAIDKRGKLIYHIKKSQDSNLPQQIKLSGNWSLDKDHNLIFTLDKWNNQYAKDKLAIQGQILDVKGNELLFRITTKTQDNSIHIYVLSLCGAWQIDRHNRITFNIEKEGGLYGSLAFQGMWQVNKNNQIIYSYTKTNLKRKEKITKTLTFQGYWDISKRYRLSYILNKKMNSSFDFTVSVGTGIKEVNRYGLRYELGASINGKPRIKNRTITLFGRWKIKNSLGLIFEMEYENKTIKAITFGADIKLNKDNSLSVRIKNSLNEDLGISLNLSKNLFKEKGQAFLNILKTKREVNLVAGLGFIW